jgi:hypothetical protein
MVACNAKQHKAAKSAITASGTDNDTDDDMDDDESANHGFRVKGDVPCQLANHAGRDAVDGQ